MSLLQTLPYKEYQKALEFSMQQCEMISKLADLKITFNDIKKPGEQLVKALDRRGYSFERYKNLILSSLNIKTICTYYKPQTKVAVFIANDKYEHLSKLATPLVDCNEVASILKDLGFIIVIIKNKVSNILKKMLSEIFEVIPEDSYCFIFYAGHGCQLCNIQFMLSTDCPAENIKWEHAVTDNFILNEVAKCKPDLCVLIVDMCRVYLDRSTNPHIYNSVPLVEDFPIYKNLLIGYSATCNQAAYEVLEIECSTTIDNEFTYELKTGDSARIVPGGSQYANALCSRLEENLDISSLLDKVHADVEMSVKKQRPIKWQCGTAKRSLYDPAIGDTVTLLNKLKEACKDDCNVF